jgi:hypothetical protein
MFLPFFVLLAIVLGKEYYYDCQHSKEVNAAKTYLQVLYDTTDFQKVDKAKNFMLEFGGNITNIYACKILSHIPHVI